MLKNLYQQLVDMPSRILFYQYLWISFLQLYIQILVILSQPLEKETKLGM